MSFKIHFLFCLLLCFCIADGQDTISIESTKLGPFFNSLPAAKLDLPFETDNEYVLDIKNIDLDQKTTSIFISDAEIQEIHIGEQIFYTGKYQNRRRLGNRWDNRHFTIPSHLLSNGSPIFKGQNITKKDPILAPAVLSTESIQEGLIHIIASSKNGIFFTIFFIGGIFIFLVYTIGLFIQTINPDFKFYAYYLSAILLHNLIQADEFLKIYALFPRNPIWYHNINEFLQMFIYAFFMLFIKVFLDLDKEKPRMARFVNRSISVTIIFGFLFLGTALFTRNFVFLQDYLSILWVVVALLGTIIVVGVYRNSKNPVRYYILIGSVFLLMGSFLELYTSLNLKGGYNWNLYAIPNFKWYPFNYTQAAILLETICFALGIGYKIRIQERKLLKLQQKEIDDLKIKEKNIDLEKQLLEKELTALRSQMNPHFLFNSLNSVNNYIMKEEPQLASKYLTRFSLLMRTILNNSKQKFVSLEQELEAIRLYVELENLRFKNKFDYTIRVPDNLSTNQILIPPMLIQPYVENAIKHGLMPKNSDGKLSLELSERNSVLGIVVSDDGIGREASTKAKSTQEKQRKSHGMEITSNRINLLNKIYDLDAEIEITDKAPGTQVKLTLNVITDEANVISNSS